MLEKNTLIKVTNRDNGRVGYMIPDLGNLVREFESGETKEITMEELRKLSYLQGGKSILKKYLVLDNKEAVRELISDVEPEYYYTEKEIKYLLLHGTLDQLRDCLDFAPIGTINLLQEMAVKLRLNDIAKRNIILEMTGFNVTKAIEINDETSEDSDNSNSNTHRRTTSIIKDMEHEEGQEKTRRSEEKLTRSKYNVVSIKN